MRALQGSFLALCLIGLAMSEISESETHDAVRAVSQGVNQFSVDFFKIIAKKHQGNLICSPLSVNIALTMAATGAGGSTKAQFTDALHLPSLSDTLHGNKLFINTLNDVENVTLKIANKMFIADGFDVKPSYKRDLQTYFRSDIESVDFSDAEKAAGTVNDWVKDRTNNRIDSIIQPGDLNPSPALILANAVYFKGKWAQQFDVAHTENRPFHIDESTTKNVPTMYQKGYFKYVDLPDYDAKCIQLPYANKDISMVIILPNQINDLPQLSEKMKEAFQHCVERLNSAYQREVKLFLPKFKVETKLDLEDTLRDKMGLSEPFSDRANFSGISPTPLKISKVVQKAFIEVNEEGSEAAAVTELEMTLFSAPIEFPEEKFIVDHPFLYSIIKLDCNHETENRDMTLFVGRIIEPTV